jgi:hypothetical protein
MEEKLKVSVEGKEIGQVKICATKARKTDSREKKSTGRSGVREGRF